VNGFSHKEEVEKLLAAIIALGGPGEVLRGVAEKARDAFRNLDYAGESVAADDLAKRLVVVLRRWDRKTKAMVRN